MHNYKELKVWQKSRALVKEVYTLLSNFPNEEKFGLTNQIKRSLISIPSNIAEGAGRDSDNEFSRFLKIALGSSYELETQIILALDLEIINNEKARLILKSINEVQMMIYGLIKSLTKKSTLTTNY